MSSELLNEEAKHVGRWSRGHAILVKQGVQRMLACNPVSSRVTLTRENVFSVQGTQFSRLNFLTENVNSGETIQQKENLLRNYSLNLWLFKNCSSIILSFPAGLPRTIDINWSMVISFSCMQFQWQFLITNSGFWLVNILLRKLDTSWKKK